MKETSFITSCHFSCLVQGFPVKCELLCTNSLLVLLYKCSFWENGMNFAATHTVVDMTRHTSPPGWQQSASKINRVK